ncbi:MAG: phenylalanine--tRNA ligase subunit alpha [Candidatus Latescibacteria bacterium]|nr:phenylalanine--tRNA ligase subunit alpha [Candidatus Latescibacterota bacterium]NIM21527.1 phenylalanine--tRNA ligase subunit alpha [Candidatus Latescibacterota bacterium]NIM65698.1 phenylalanine--tRNA ligase subunit alpha [Candidatus Latescibacterota bacterium]NIO02080.1 phenylalanine--tRNA ligase subunit alpha [Candidatus Latescibacterota bacterium]NIO28892.1 phenylalanine--tRNA ligase subunit alpha [Candidatus Latescibacterota bacterium]
MDVENIEKLESKIRWEINRCERRDDLQAVRVKYLGRKGQITLLLRSIKDAPPRERPRLGAACNRLKDFLEEQLAAKAEELSRAGEANELYQPPHDPTLPAHDGIRGHRHVISMVLRRMKEIFYGMGYSLAEGPDVELEYYNFQALNFPEEHPSRDTQDTFYVTDDILLRTHTSPVQIRYMESHTPPLKIIAPGKVYRNESIDPSHAAEFYQVEGLYVDTDVSLADLKKEVEIFVQQLFGPQTQIRFRPDFFPFVEPGVDVAMTCFGCLGKGCQICKQTGWIEVMGAGMVHPSVFRAVGYDPDVYSGFAFGMGVDRLAMLMYGISDIRLFLADDLRFLYQF